VLKAACLSGFFISHIEQNLNKKSVAARSLFRLRFSIHTKVFTFVFQIHGEYGKI
jgi:hypothetical protein